MFFGIYNDAYWIVTMLIYAMTVLIVYNQIQSTAEWISDIRQSLKMFLSGQLDQNTV